MHCVRSLFESCENQRAFLPNWKRRITISVSTGASASNVVSNHLLVLSWLSNPLFAFLKTTETWIGASALQGGMRGAWLVSEGVGGDGDNIMHMNIFLSRTVSANCLTVSQRSHYSPLNLKTCSWDGAF